MDTENAYYGAILKRYFHQFKSVTHHGVPICKYIYHRFFQFVVNRWSFSWAKKNLPCFQDMINQMADGEVYSWSDEPYQYDPHPGGIILMRGGFGDIASLFLPNERFYLVSPNQAEVDVIKTNRADLVSHNIENKYQENPKAVAELTGQIAELITGQVADPILGSPDLLKWFTNKMPSIVQMIDAFHSLFEELSVGAVLTISSIYEMDSALNLIARANRVPSITLQHGIIADSGLFCHIPLLATKKAVWGKVTREWYNKFGFPESKVAIVGSPRFDIIFNRKWCDKQKLCQMLGIDSSKKIMVFTTQFPKYASTMVPIIVNGLKSIPDLFTIMLLHPSESAQIDNYRQLSKDYLNCKVFPFGHISLYDALSGADFFITYCSTSALEAMFFKLPVITLEPFPLIFSYGELGASLRVTNSAELNQVVNRLISDKTFRKNSTDRYQNFISEYCIPDGFASKRLFDELEQLCQSGGIV